MRKESSERPSARTSLHRLLLHPRSLIHTYKMVSESIHTLHEDERDGLCWGMVLLGPGMDAG